MFVFTWIQMNLRKNKINNLILYHVKFLAELNTLHFRFPSIYITIEQIYFHVKKRKIKRISI